MSMDYRRWSNQSSRTLGVFSLISSIAGLISFIYIAFGEFGGVDILLFLSLSTVTTFFGTIFGIVNLAISTKAAKESKWNHATGITLSTISLIVCTITICCFIMFELMIKSQSANINW